MMKIDINKKKIKNIFYKNLIQLNDYIENGELLEEKVGELFKGTASLLIYNNPFNTQLPKIKDFLPLDLNENLDYLKIDSDFLAEDNDYTAYYDPENDKIVFKQQNCDNIVSFIITVAHEYTHFIQKQIVEYVIEHPNVEINEKVSNVVDDTIFPINETSTLCDFIRLYKKLNYKDFSDVADYFHHKKATQFNYQRIINQGIYFQFHHEEQARDCSYNFFADLYNEMQKDTDCPKYLKELLNDYYDNFLTEQDNDMKYRRSPSYTKLRKLYHECCDIIANFPINRIAKIEGETLKNDVGNLKLNKLRKNRASGKEFIGTLYALQIEPTPYNNLAIKLYDTQKAYLEYVKTYRNAEELDIANLFNNTMLNIDTFEKEKFSSNDEILDVSKYWLKTGNYNSLFYLMKIINEVENPIYSTEVAKRIIDFRNLLLNDKKFIGAIDKKFGKIEKLIDENPPLSKADVKLLKECKNISYIHKSLQAPVISQTEKEKQKQYYYNINTLAQDLLANYDEQEKQDSPETKQVEAFNENEVSNQEN